MKKFLIHERFLTFQGEGVHLGRKAYFIRTYGCPLKCSFCDSAGTWDPKFKPDNMEQLTVNEMAVAVLESKAPIVVLTGGEPAIHNWQEFCRALMPYNVKVHMETSGAFPFPRGNLLDWITLSPKRAHLPSYDAVTGANEFKVIVETPEDIAFWHEILTVRGYTEDKPIWLHPEWSQRENPVVLRAIAEAVIHNPWNNENLRAGWQLHKLYNVDQLDPGCRPNVPLGGGQKLEPTSLPL